MWRAEVYRRVNGWDGPPWRCCAGGGHSGRRRLVWRSSVFHFLSCFDCQREGRWFGNRSDFDSLQTIRLSSAVISRFVSHLHGKSVVGRVIWLPGGCPFEMVLVELFFFKLTPQFHPRSVSCRIYPSRMLRLPKCNIDLFHLLCSTYTLE